MNIYLIRHGQSVGNIRKNLEGTPSPFIDLTVLGEKQSNLAGKILKEHFLEKNLDLDKTYLYSSSYKRARKTSEIIAKIMELDKFRDDDRLIEQDFGLMNCMEREEIERLFPEESKIYNKLEEMNGKYYVRYPLGDSAVDVSLRVKSFIDTMFRDAERNGIENFIIVSHGNTNKVFVKNWFHYSPEWYQEEKLQKNCTIRWIERISEGKSIDRGYI